MAKFKPGDLVVLKHFARIERWPDHKGKGQEPLQNAILQKTSVRYVCRDHSKNGPYGYQTGGKLPNNYLAPGEVGVLKDYDYLYMADLDYYREADLKRHEIDPFILNKAVVCDEPDPWAKLARDGDPNKTDKVYYVDRRENKYMFVAIDGKLIAFERGSYAFETSDDAGDRYQNIEVFYSFREDLKYMTEKERIRETNKIIKGQRWERLQDPEITKIIYTEKDGSKRVVNIAPSEEEDGQEG